MTKHLRRPRPLPSLCAFRALSAGLVFLPCGFFRSRSATRYEKLLQGSRLPPFTSRSSRPCAIVFDLIAVVDKSTLRPTGGFVPDAELVELIERLKKKGLSGP